MKDFSIIVRKGDKLSSDRLLEWLSPLNLSGLGSIAIFEAESLSEFLLLANRMGISCALIANPAIATDLYPNVLGDRILYSIRIEYLHGKEYRLAFVPDCDAIEAEKLKPLLDRFDELL